MAATFEFEEDTGTATGSPTKGTTRTAAVTDVNWKNSGVKTDVYSSFPITAGLNSFEKWQFGHFSGTFNTILSGLYQHTSVALTDFAGGSTLTLKGQKAMTADGDNLTYTTPSATTNANLTKDQTATAAIGSGVAVWFGATGPEATGKAATMATNPCYTNWLTTQLQVAGGAAAGDTSIPVTTLQYQEN
jgi:hypothetical protein